MNRVFVFEGVCDWRCSTGIKTACTPGKRLPQLQNIASAVTCHAFKASRCDSHCWPMATPGIPVPSPSPNSARSGSGGSREAGASGFIPVSPTLGRQAFFRFSKRSAASRKSGFYGAHCTNADVLLPTCFHNSLRSAQHVASLASSQIHGRGCHKLRQGVRLCVSLLFTAKEVLLPRIQVDWSGAVTTRYEFRVSFSIHFRASFPNASAGKHGRQDLRSERLTSATAAAMRAARHFLEKGEKDDVMD